MEQSLAHRRRLCEQYNELLDHGVSRPIDLEAGALAVYGEQGGTGHLVITRFRPDDRLEIVDMVEEAQVARAVERLQKLPSAPGKPYTIRIAGKLRSFQATYKWPLIGFCRADKDTVFLLSSGGAGLILTGQHKGSWYSRDEDWRETIDLTDEADLDADADGAEPHARAARPARIRPAKAVDRVGEARRVSDVVQAARGARPHAGAPGPAKRVGELGDEVQAEYARLARGRVFDVATLEALSLYLDQLGRQAAVPHPRFGSHHKAILHAPAVFTGLRTAAANGCLRLCGREKAIREQLAVYGVDLPAGCVAPVLRLLCELGCVFVRRLPAAEDRSFSRRYVIELGGAIDPEDPMHLMMLRATRTPHREVVRDDGTSARGSGPLRGDVPAAAREHVAGEAATRTASGPPPGRPAASGPTYREFLQLAVGVMLVLGREVLDAHDLAVASLNTAQAAGSAPPDVAAPGSVPIEREVPAPPSVSPEMASQEGELRPPSKAGQADAAGVGQRWSFAAAISSAEREMAAAGRWAEAVDGHAWHALAWPLPRVTTSLPQADPRFTGDLLIEPGRSARTDETLWLRPASVRVQPPGGVGYAAPRIATRPWIAAHVARSDAGPRGPPRRRV